MEKPIPKKECDSLRVHRYAKKLLLGRSLPLTGMMLLGRQFAIQYMLFVAIFVSTPHAPHQRAVVVPCFRFISLCVLTGRRLGRC